jgi:SsrA-binding protein
MEMKNRQAYHEYFIDDKLDAGMVLSGTEVKALRDGKVSFADAYCLFHKGELFVKSLNIPEYRLGNYYNHLTTRDRKLLLRKKELRKWEGKMKEKGYTIIPLRIYFNDKGLAKIEIGLARGKKLHDKRDTIREREMDRDIKRKYGL